MAGPESEVNEVLVAVAAAVGKELASTVTEPFKNLTRPGTLALGNHLGLEIDAWCAERRAKLEQKIAAALEMREISNERLVAPKLVVALMTAGSLEDDETLFEMFAELAANASDPSFSGDVTLLHVETLKQLSPDDALVLLKLYSALKATKDDQASDHMARKRLIELCEIPHERAEKAIQRLLHVRLLRERTFQDEIGATFAKLSKVDVQLQGLADQARYLERDDVAFTDIGYDFIVACTNPKNTNA